MIVSIRPEQMRIVTDANGATPIPPHRNRLVGRVVETTFLGESMEHVLDVNGQRLKVVSSPPLHDNLKTLTVEFDSDDAVVLW